MQRELVQLVDQYSDRNLHRAFSKKRTAKEFLDSVEEKTIGDHIRPFIEKRIHRALEIARDNRIRLFLKDKSDAMEMTLETMEPGLDLIGAAEARHARYDASPAA